MKKIEGYIKKHPVWGAVILFVVLSLIAHTIWILYFSMPHIYDIVHAIPTIFVYGPIIESMGGFVATEFIFVPLALLLDGLFGALCGWVLRKRLHEDTAYLLGIVIAFAVYWIVLTYQWLPIF